MHKMASANFRVEVLADERVDPAAKDNYAITTACRAGNEGVVCLLRQHPAVVVTKSVLSAADAAGQAGVVALLLSKQSQVMNQLCHGEVVCVAAGPLLRELKQWEARSAFTMLLALKRTQTSQVAARVSDVLRDACELYARFHVVEVQVDAGSVSDSGRDTGGDSDSDRDTGSGSDSDSDSDSD
jgi:hypothetical protein